VVIHVTLLEGSSGSSGLKHMKIFESTCEPLLHPLFTQEPAVAASAPDASGFAGQFDQGIFEYPILHASCLSKSVNSISQLLSWGPLLPAVSTLLQLDNTILPVLACGTTGAITE